MPLAYCTIVIVLPPAGRCLAGRVARAGASETAGAASETAGTPRGAAASAARASAAGARFVRPFVTAPREAVFFARPDPPVFRGLGIEPLRPGRRGLRRFEAAPLPVFARVLEFHQAVERRL